MKILTVLTTLVACLALGITAQADSRVYVKCPKWIVNKSKGTFRRLPKIEDGSLIACSNNAGTLRKLGYIEEGRSDPQLPTVDPQLDVERVIHGIGSGEISRLFRVSTVARVLTATAIDCGDRFNFLAYRLLDSKGRFLKTGTAYHGESDSMTISEPGVYGISVSSIALSGSTACKYEIKVQ